MSDNIFIIGFGRFGKLLFDLLKDETSFKSFKRFNVSFFDSNEKFKNHENYKNLQDGVSNAQHVFLCVPIRGMKNIISEISGFLKPGTVVLDVCSVKLLPCEWMLEGLPDNIDIIATHPMFGPDSYSSGLNTDLQIMLYSLRSISNNSSYKLWCEFFISKKLNILEITPDEHDSHVAFSQGVTHLIGRVLDKMKLDEYSNLDSDKKIKPVTKGFESLMQVKEQTCHDSIDLFHDMIVFNPHAKKMLTSFNLSLKEVLSFC
jgi:prephenate dehydrogenase